ncbi:MAG: hypothetical protein RIS47_1813 [Bacteroidota bacterium]|jgi:CheY-like chemotaxis protein
MQNWENKTILITEDTPMNYKLIEIILRRTKAKLLWAKNGQEAVDICRENEDIDAVLMDLQLPVLDGYEATTQIKSIRPSLPVITQTAFTFNNERAKSIQAGADAFLTKPIDAVKLIQVLQGFIE